MREKTNSITHLFKIVAREVAEEVFLENMKEMKVTRIKETYIEAGDFIKNVIISAKKAGEIWSEGEDFLLIDEVKAAIAQIAKNHQRSVGAIKARISQKSLTDG